MLFPHPAEYSNKTDKIYDFYSHSGDFMAAHIHKSTQVRYNPTGVRKSATTYNVISCSRALPLRLVVSSASNRKKKMSPDGKTTNVWPNYKSVKSDISRTLTNIYKGLYVFSDFCFTIQDYLNNNMLDSMYCI